MGKLLAALYSALVYVFFLGVFLYAIGFVENTLVPKSIDSGTSGSVADSLLIDAGLLVLFAVQHSVMARPGFKRRWTRIVSRRARIRAWKRSRALCRRALSGHGPRASTCPALHRA